MTWPGQIPLGTARHFPVYHCIPSLLLSGALWSNMTWCRGLRALLWKAQVCCPEHLGSLELKTKTQDLARGLNITSVGFQVPWAHHPQSLESPGHRDPLPSLLSACPPSLQTWHCLLLSYLELPWVTASTFPGSVTVVCVSTQPPPPSLLSRLPPSPPACTPSESPHCSPGGALAGII